MNLIRVEVKCSVQDDVASNAYNMITCSVHTYSGSSKYTRDDNMVLWNVLFEGNKRKKMWDVFIMYFN